MNKAVIKEAIILAGGLGTRLRSSVPDLPKCMAPVAGKPFVGHVVDYFLKAGVEKFIFALGYKSSYFDEFLETTLPRGNYTVSLEDEPLGTGGAIRQACGLAEDAAVLVLNGDTFFGIDLAALSGSHSRTDASCSLCLKPMTNFDRYGAVSIDDNGRVLSFHEKQFYAEGLINGGIYALNTASFLSEGLPEKFSFEKEYLEVKVAEGRFYGIVQQGYFIDIGIPADFERAQTELNAHL